MSISINCPHCQKYTAVSILETQVHTGENKRNSTTFIYPQTISWKNYETGDEWSLGKCNACAKVILILNDGEKVYPKSQPQKTDKAVPEHICEDMDEAKLCFSVNALKATVVMCRRAIEAVCKDKGATKSRLFEMIDELYSKGVITKDLKEWAHEVRYMGNDGAHANLKNITKEDVEDILELAEQFLTVIYITSATLQRRKNKRISD